MQLESKEPSHGAFASLCNALKGLVHLDPLVTTHTERNTVNKAYACAFAEQNLLDEQYQWKCNLTFQFYESIVSIQLPETDVACVCTPSPDRNA